jgi:hypothetical protein
MSAVDEAGELGSWGVGVSNVQRRASELRLHENRERQPVLRLYIEEQHERAPRVSERCQKIHNTGYSRVGVSKETSNLASLWTGVQCDKEAIRPKDNQNVHQDETYFPVVDSRACACSAMHGCLFGSISIRASICD